MADIAGLIERTVAGMGYELVDFETSPRARLLRVFIDKPGGVTVDDCAGVSHQLTRLFMVENIDYDRLEVSSPGLDRPLKKPADYERFVGQAAHIKLRLPEGGNQRNFSGTIIGLRENQVCLATEGGEREFAFDNIEKARLVPRF